MFSWCCQLISRSLFDHMISKSYIFVIFRGELVLTPKYYAQRSDEHRDENEPEETVPLPRGNGQGLVLQEQVRAVLTHITWTHLAQV